MIIVKTAVPNTPASIARIMSIFRNINSPCFASSELTPITLKSPKKFQPISCACFVRRRPLLKEIFRFETWTNQIDQPPVKPA